MLYSWKFYCRKSAVVIQTFPVIAIDDNECEFDPSICGRDATCFNTDGSYFCQCHKGFTTHSTHNFTQADAIECEGKESLIWWISYDLCAAEKTSESLLIYFQTLMNVWMAALIVVLIHNVSILKEVISAHVKIATLPAMEKRCLMQDKEFSVLVRNYFHPKILTFLIYSSSSCLKPVWVYFFCLV